VDTHQGKQWTLVYFLKFVCEDWNHILPQLQYR